MTEIQENFYDGMRAAEKGLLSSGLPITMPDLIGFRFVFGCKYGSHYQILVGTITGVRISDIGGFQLQISNEKMGGDKIDCIIQTEEGWELITLPEEKECSRPIMGATNLYHPKDRGYYPGVFLK
ncbi:MAG: hypothetical protein PHE59_01445 [Patescibacteria group bacterium]|nr:hypothetical protein [Patescibacteria group bacterium]MDD5164040.1 hypothetical protein [Patescibacteria group bacterium]MDD5534876.1 hypothetical protein [Patescibacteria group bacterium]